jgi:hypothetical protein
MKKILLIGLLAAVLTAAYGYAEMGPGMMERGYGSEKELEAYERHRGQGGGMYPGMPGCGMGPGWGMGQGMMGYGGGHMMGQGWGMGPGMMGYGMGRGMHDPQAKEFLDETKDLRKSLHMKHFEYFEAMRDPDTPPKTMKRLRDETWELKKKLFDKRWEKFEKQRKK